MASLPRRNAPINIVPNPNFEHWHSEPASHWVETEVGAGFVQNSIADGWYGGPGPGGKYGFTRGVFGSTQVEVPGFPKYYGVFIYLTGPTSGSADEYTIDRAPIIEHSDNGKLSFNTLAGQTFSYSFYGRVNFGTFKVVPNLWVATGQMGWLPGQQKNIGDYIGLALCFSGAKFRHYGQPPSTRNSIGSE